MVVASAVARPIDDDKTFGPTRSAFRGGGTLESRPPQKDHTQVHHSKNWENLSPHHFRAPGAPHFDD